MTFLIKDLRNFIRKMLRGKRKAGRRTPRRNGLAPQGRSPISVVKGRGLLTFPSSTDGAGLPVTNRYEIDTSLFASWSDLALCFQKWRIRELRFNFVSQQGTNLPGLIAMCVLPDPDCATPTSIDVVVSNQHSAVGPHYSCPSLRYVPRNNTNWLFTSDILADEDRLEMPGDFIFQSSSWTSVQAPGRVYVDYWVEFTEVTNTLAGLSRQRTIRDKTNKSEIPLASLSPSARSNESPRTREDLRSEILGLVDKFKLTPG